jgi:hypothetical protein
MKEYVTSLNIYKLNMIDKIIKLTKIKLQVGRITKPQPTENKIVIRYLI